MNDTVAETLIQFETLRLTDESVKSLQDSIRIPRANASFGEAMWDAAEQISHHLPRGMSQEDLVNNAQSIARQIGRSAIGDAPVRFGVAIEIQYNAQQELEGSAAV